MNTKLKITAVAASISVALGALLTAPVQAGSNSSATTTTPIKHVVVIFQENISFDHYFATYPYAVNPANEPTFTMAPLTPTVNGLGLLVNGQPVGTLLTNNPNASNTTANGSNAINPFRLDHSQASTCDQDHDYGDEQSAFDGGLMDLFPSTVGETCATNYTWGKGVGIVMGYYDGNTATAVWNYAQNFALNDNFYGTTFGPSTPGALNLIARQHLSGLSECGDARRCCLQRYLRHTGQRPRPHR